MPEQWKDKMGQSKWHSSYEEHAYGELFYALIKTYQPEKVVELGTKDGYSAYHIARGLTDNKKGKLFCYDLWEKYEFSSCSQAVAAENLKEVKDVVQLTLRDAVGVDQEHDMVDILHVDVSNKGEILEEIIPKWIDKVRQCIIIEGGSPERDKVEWMVKFKKQPIADWLKQFAKQRGDIEYFTVAPFPSITLIRKH